MARALFPLLALYLLTQLALLPLVDRERRSSGHRPLAQIVRRDSLVARPKASAGSSRPAVTPNGIPPTVLELSPIEIP